MFVVIIDHQIKFRRYCETPDFLFLNLPFVSKGFLKITSLSKKTVQIWQVL